MAHPRYFVILLAVMLFACSPATPQPTETPAPQIADAACPEIVTQAMEATDLNCTQTGRNQVCYGNVSLQVTPQTGVDSLKFDAPGDIVDLASLQSLNLSSMNTETREWGVALMAVQANLPDSLPGQNVTILLFGNVQLENAPAEDGEFAFFFQSGVGDAPCAEAPDSGILVQTPDGAGEVQFTANGVDIQLGSTAYLQAQSGVDMDINVVEGQAVVAAQGVSQTVRAGLGTVVPLDANRQPAGPPSPPSPYQSAKLQVLPVTHLARPVGITSVLVSSTFATDDEGWTSAGDGTPITHNAADSTSDGSICADDTTTGNDWYFSAPQSWLGDQSAAYGGGLRFVLRQSEDDAQYDSDDVLLTGGGITLTYNTAENPGTDWTAYTVPLVETAGWINASTGAAPTRDEMMAVLSSLTELKIRGEYREGGDTGCLDEAQLVSVLMPMAQGRVVQIEPTQIVPTGTPERSIAGQVSGQGTPTPTALPPTGAQIGFEVTDTLNTVGEQKPYTFTAEAGHMLYLDGLSDSPFIRATLTDEAGTEAAPEWWLDRDNGLVTLETGGTYTLTVFSVQDTIGPYSFKLWDVPPPLTFEYAIDETVSEGVPGAGAGVIETPGVQDIYTFTGDAGQTVYFDGLGDSPFLRAHVTDDTGAEVAPEWWLDRDNGVATLERGGMYTITAFGSQDATGAYSFKLWNVPPPQTFEIAIGDTVSDGVPAAGAGNIETPGTQDIFTFTADAGQIVFFDGLSDNAYLRARVTDDTNTQVMPEWWLDRDNNEVTLERGGTYTITVFGAQEATGAYSFKLWDVSEAQSYPINIGDAVTDGVPSAGAGNIETPGSQDVYTFTADAGQTILFDGQGGSAYIRADLADDTGALIFENEWIDRTAAVRTLERGGTYTITVYGADATTGPYAFQVWDVPAPQIFEIAIGDTVDEDVPGTGAGNIETPGVQDVYTFNAEAGQVIFFDSVNGNAYIRAIMTDEDGTPIFENEWTDRAAVQRTVERGGTYTITVQGVDDTVGTYSFQLWNVAPPQTFEIAIGDSVSDGVPGEGAGNIETPGAQDLYTFTAEAGEVIILEGQTPNGYIRWTLLDESGEEVFENVMVSGQTGPYTLTRGGVYTLKVFGDLDAVGTYEFAFVTQ